MCTDMFERTDNIVTTTQTDFYYPELDPRTSIIIYGLLLREDFRHMLASTEYGRDYFTDSNSYVHVPESIGCFRNERVWIVYETDEIGTPIIERQFEDPLLAYQDAASRKGLHFSPRYSTSAILLRPISEKYALRALRTIRAAISTLKRIDKLMQITDQPDALKEDIQLLMDTANKLRAYLLTKKERTNQSDNAYRDKKLVCKDCRKPFVLTVAEQKYYAERGFQNISQRCSKCRNAYKPPYRARFKNNIARCSQCGKYFVVPPGQIKRRLIYCNKCIKKIVAQKA